MGLAERRALKAFAEEKYPAIKKELDQVAGFELNVDVQWDDMAAEEYENLYDEAFTKVYFIPLKQALEAIVVDEMGKKALKEGLKKILIRNYSGSHSITFANGELLFEANSISNLDYGDDRRKELQQVLEKGL